MHSNPPVGNLDTSFSGITHDVLDKMFERSPLWQSRDERRLITPTITTDAEGIQKYLLQGSPVPKNTVELLTVLDALIARDDLSRAAMIVASLKRQLEPSTPLSTLVYNKYLEGVVMSSIEKSGGVGNAMEWYQEMTNNGVKPDRTTFALLAKAAYSLASVQDGNRAARRVFGLWRNEGGEIGDLLCDLMFPQEEILRSLKVPIPRNCIDIVKQNVAGRYFRWTQNSIRDRHSNNNPNSTSPRRNPTLPRREYPRPPPNPSKITQPLLH